MAEDEIDNGIIPSERFTPEPEIENREQQNAENTGSGAPLLINGQYIKDLSFVRVSKFTISNLTFLLEYMMHI